MDSWHLRDRQTDLRSWNLRAILETQMREWNIRNTNTYFVRFFTHLKYEEVGLLSYLGPPPHWLQSVTKSNLEHAKSSFLKNTKTGQNFQRYKILFQRAPKFICTQSNMSAFCVYIRFGTKIQFNDLCDMEFLVLPQYHMPDMPVTTDMQLCCVRTISPPQCSPQLFPDARCHIRLLLLLLDGCIEVGGKPTEYYIYIRHTRVHRCSRVSYWTNATGPVDLSSAHGPGPAVPVSRAAATPRDPTREIYV